MKGINTILIVDDDAALRKLLKFHLENAGFEVVTAGDGHLGLELAEKHQPALIVLDLHMPRMSGMTFYERILGKDGKPRYPILVLTGKANLKDVFKDFTVEAFVTKPFNVNEMIQMIREIVTRSFGSGLSVEDAPKSEENGGRQRLLLVDDDKALLESLTRVFKEKGFTVDDVTAGAECIEYAFAYKPDIMVIKLGLPDLSGDFVVSRLKQMPRTKKIPFVLYTSQDHKLTDPVIAKICDTAGIKPTELLQSTDVGDLAREVQRRLNGGAQ